jgi:hypothetical protein
MQTASLPLSSFSPPAGSHFCGGPFAKLAFPERGVPVLRVSTLPTLREARIGRPRLQLG